MAYTYNNGELAVFMQAKRDETGTTNAAKKRKYFVPQVDEKNGVNATTDIGREFEFMTCKNPTKFLSMTEESHLGDHQDKLWSILVCYSPTFDPSETGNIVFVFDKKYNFIRFATLLAVLYGCQWPLFQPGKSQGERNKFFKSMPSYNERYNPAYIGYLLGYQMKDILAWGYNNGDFTL